jgi:hypothetical protein
MAAQLSVSQFLDNLYTTTWQNRQEGTADNVFNATPFWFWMKENGRLIPQRGGRFIEENLEYAANNNIVWLQKGSTVPLNDFEFLTVAQYQWKYIAASIVRFGVDDQQNAGKAKIISLMNSKMENTEQALIEQFEAAITGGPGTTAPTGSTEAVVGADLAIDGLQCLVAAAPQTTPGGDGVAVGGIDSSIYTWWQNQYFSMAGSSFATNGVNNMRHMLNNCMNNRIGDRPDIILSDQQTYEYYEQSVLSYLRITNNKLGDAGFENQTFKQIPMVWSPTIASGGTMYFLNSRFLKLIYDPSMYFTMTEWKPIPDQVNDRAAQIATACALTTNRRRVHGVISSINTP